MRRTLLIGLLLALGTAATAYAGLKENTPVVVTKAADGSGNFFGALHTARNSNDNKMSIFCRVFLNPGAPPLVQCAATDGRGRSLMCSTTDPTLVQVVHIITNNSLLNVSVSADGQCSQIIVRNGSTFAGV